MEQQYTLRLILDAPYGGKSYEVALPVDAFDVWDKWEGLTPPSDLDFVIGNVALDRVVDRIRKRQYRKEDFERLCQMLGRKLGERMEDEEGWHGVSRQEAYERLRSDGHRGHPHPI
ncbi:hypothetical protein [Sphingopyxis sp. JAI128]|uniref:hypothetical protein n=1 Tax=Sphingopyxis sp. JAI128 TaxID=2723066 RepID=UPI00160A6C1F|nr:hypothetical protein [Sphingopyxis sp. JAI128]MBB6424924.1 hypothetical protein [Sphingopyxis sp. JAI128]